MAGRCLSAFRGQRQAACRSSAPTGIAPQPTGDDARAAPSRDPRHWGGGLGGPDLRRTRAAGLAGACPVA